MAHVHLRLTDDQEKAIDKYCAAKNIKTRSGGYIDALNRILNLEKELYDLNKKYADTAFKLSAIQGRVDNFAEAFNSLFNEKKSKK